MPDELDAIMKEHNMKNIKFSGPGALSRSIPLPERSHLEQMYKKIYTYCKKIRKKA
jgi:hypothetical protein